MIYKGPDFSSPAPMNYFLKVYIMENEELDEYDRTKYFLDANREKYMH